MEIRDLRIGNYVEYNGMSTVVTELWTPKPRKPESFNNVPVVEIFCGGLISCPLSEINPIPITEEILLRFEFEAVPETLNYYYHDGILGLFEVTHGKVQYTIDSNIVCEIEYLHQLQNLFYCLCGFELEVNWKES